MDYTQFLCMREELSLLMVLVLVFITDLFMSPDIRKEKNGRKINTIVPVALLAAHTIWNAVPGTAFEIFGGMYHYIPLHTIIKTILNTATIIVFLMADNWLNQDDTKHKQGEFYILTLSTLFGLHLMISAGHFLLFFIGLETASIPMAALIAFDKFKHNSAEAGAKYILSAIFSSALLMFGLSMIYGTTGTLYFNDLPIYIDGSPLQIMGFVFFFTGMAFKISLVPFHLWTADVYEGAPTSVTAYLSVVSKCGAAFVLMTTLVKVFLPLIGQWQEILLWIITITITIANVFAVRQKNLKRLMAFSSISQAGYLMLGVIGGSPDGMAALTYYALVYAAANLGVFAVIALIGARTGKESLEDYNGLYSTNPKLAFLMTLSLFSLAGIPPFAGFFSKFFIFMAAFKAGFHLLVFIALLNTVISLYYYLLIVKAMYINKSETPVETIKSDCYTKFGLLICTVGVIGLGIASFVFEYIDKFSFGIY